MPRFTIDFDTLTDKRLTDIAESKNISKAEIIRRALSLYLTVDERIEHELRLTITDKSGKIIIEVVFI
jgi:Ribbon-helix-helix protein, copG family.